MEPKSNVLFVCINLVNKADYDNSYINFSEIKMLLGMH